MRAAPVTWSKHDPITYAHTDYARIVRARGTAVLVGEEDDGETARQLITQPGDLAVIGLGPESSATRASADLLAAAGVRLVSTVGDRLPFEPLPITALAHAQAGAFFDDVLRDAAIRRLYAGRFVDSTLLGTAPVKRLRFLDEELREETYAKYVKRFRPARFTRKPAGTDKTNVALTWTEGAVTRVAADVVKLLGLSPALGLIRTDSHLAFAQDLADAFRLDVTIPVGFLTGGQKLPEDEAQAFAAEQLHRHRLIPKMVTLATAVVAAAD